MKCWLSGRPGISMYVSTARCAVQLADGDEQRFQSPLEITISLLRKIERYLVDKPVLECVHAYHSKVSECLAFEGSDWAGDRDTRRSTTAVLESCEPLH